jgi:hypothetical protein
VTQNLNILRLFLFLILTLIPTSFAVAWQHELSMGYGNGKEIERNYNNRGVQVYAKLYRFRDIDERLIATIDANFVEIISETADYNHLFAISAPLALRAYFFTQCHCVRPYMEISFGPSYISQKQLGLCQQGNNFCFESNLVAGTEIGAQTRSVDISLRLVHFCNAGIFQPNDGFDLAPVLSFGYLF